MTTTRALAVAAYLSAVAAPDAADWRSIADQLHAALPAVRGRAIASAVDHGETVASGAVPRWFADWKLGKVYSLDSLAVTFADGTALRVNLAKAPGKAPRIAAACRVAVAFYRASTGRDTVPAFASLVAASDGEAFDAAACSALTDGLRRTAYVAPAVRPAVTVEAIARMEREMERRTAALLRAFNGNTDGMELGSGYDKQSLKDMGPLDPWVAAVRGAERELATMRAALVDVPAPSSPAPRAAPAEAVTVAAEPAPCDPVAVMPDVAAVLATMAPCEPCEAVNDAGPVAPPLSGPAGAAVAPLAADVDHIEPFALCPAVGLPCKPDCGFRPTCGLPGAADPVEAEPLAPLCSDDDVPTVPVPGPVTVLCLSHKAREAVLSRTAGRAVSDYGATAKGGAFRLSLDDAAACAGVRSVRFIGLPRKPYTRATATAQTPAVENPHPAQSAPFLAVLATSMRRGYAACYAASAI